MVTLCCIDAYVYDVRSGEIGKHGHTQRLEPKAAAVLTLLASRVGELVLREEILQEVWRNQVVVEEVLTRVIGLIRKALGDEAPYQLIETLPKRGYRLMAAVKTLPNHPSVLVIEPRSSLKCGTSLTPASMTMRTSPEGLTTYRGTCSNVMSSVSRRESASCV